ncbi:MAG: hypothetical protein KME20_18485 [Kaiparowitsia implicata GSE-PSE-MK54-09C]|nr:hypothetical protein [Kaiparowitsia implicata GSE-PSE-MK54-09C]
MPLPTVILPGYLAGVALYRGMEQVVKGTGRSYCDCAAAVERLDSDGGQALGGAHY